MKLYKAWNCPFAQRAWMALLRKGIDFEYVEVDPCDYSNWWLEVSRGAALVPVVVQPNSDCEGDCKKRLVEHCYPCSQGEGSTHVARTGQIPIYPV